MDCIFCKIAAGQLPAKIIYQDDNYLAFLDIAPVSRGHSLVIPKKHVADFSSLSDEAAGALAATVHKIALRLVSALGAGGYNLGLNNGQSAGQIVAHVHWHIIPRFGSDDLHLWTADPEEIQRLEDTYNELKSKIR